MKTSTPLKISLAVTLAISSTVISASEVAHSNWQGRYAGFSLGFSKGDADQDAAVRVTDYFVESDRAQVNPVASKDLDGNSAVGSVFIGYNHQDGDIVYGIEADLSASAFNEKYSSQDIEFTSYPNTTFNVKSKLKSSWAISLKPRIGVVKDKSLFYVSAGPVIRSFDYDFAYTDTAYNQSTRVNKSSTKLGWSASVGFEQKLDSGWTLKTELTHSSFNNIVKTSSKLTDYEDGLNHKLDYSDNSIRIGLSKMF